VVPTYHPAYVLRVWEWKAPVTHDLRKRVVGKMGRPELRQEPLYNFTVPTTSYEQADERLARLCDYAVGAEDLACDIETRRGRIVCVGLGWSRLDGLCVPFMHVDGSRFWTPEQEAGLSSRLRTLLCGATDYSIGNQNWNYDRQYFIADPAFGFRPRMEFDTMIAQHLLLPGTEKSLAYLSSMYCQHHRFWKEDGKEVVDQFDEDRFFNYNCVDAVKTWEVWQQQKRLLRARGLL
jgi:DNA polymerase I-like protein with 3'-5' exonuclease and polymerase domains